MSSNQQMMNLQSPILNIEQPLSPNMKKDLEAWLEAEMMLQQMREELKKMAAGLSHMHNVMYGVMEIMNDFQNIEGAQIRGLAAVDNLDSDLRGAVTGAQTGFTGAVSGKNTNPTMAQKLIDEIKEIQAFINYEKDQGLLGKKTVMDKATLSNLQSAIDGIKAAFGSSWGNATEMATEAQSWANQSGTGKYNPNIKNVQDNLQTLNQTTSALSTATNTQLDFTTKEFQQFLGIDESAIQAYQKLDSTTIHNQRSN